jgi:hypothetical protein
MSTSTSTSISSYNDNQKKIYNRYINLNKYKNIIEQKSKDILFFNKLCGNSSLEITKYLMSLGITDNIIIESIIYASSQCDLTKFNITSEESSDLNNGNLFINFFNNFLISYYAPYYDLFNKIVIIITTIQQMKNDKTKIDWSKINKSIINNKINIIDELIIALSPNTNLITFFDLNNLKNTLSTIDITCNTNECSFTNVTDFTLSTKIQKIINNKIANNSIINCVNFLIKDFDTNYLIKEDIIQPKLETKSETNENSNKIYLIISAGIIGVIIIITMIVLIIRRNNYNNYMYPYGSNMGYGNNMSYGSNIGYRF